MTASAARPAMAFDRIALACVAWAAGGGALLAPGHPTAVNAADAVLRVLFAVGFALATSLFGRSPRSTIICALLGGVVANAALRIPTSLPARVPSAVAGALFVLVIAASHRRIPRRARRWLWRAAGIVGLFACIGAAASAIVLLQVRSEASRGLALARTGLASALRGETDTARADLNRATAILVRVDRRTSAYPARLGEFLPVVAQHHAAARRLSRQAARLTHDAARIAAEADPSELRSAGRIRLDRLARVRAAVDTGAGSLAELDATVRGVRTSPWLVPQVRRLAADAEPDLRRGRTTLTTSQDLLRVLPAMLGADGPRTYLLAVVNPSEARGGGGFLGSYGEVHVENGKLLLVRFGRTDDLNANYLATTPVSSRTFSADAGYLDTFGLYHPDEFWQNLNLGPDFTRAAQWMAERYPQSGGTPIDGVISLDTFALAAMLQLTGPISVAGWPEPFEASTAANVLMHDIYVRSTATQAENNARIAVQASLAEATWKRLTEGSLPTTSDIARVLGPVVHQRSIQVWARRPKEQAWFAAQGAAGAMRPVVSDAVAVVVNNASGSKIDWFLHRSVAYTARVDPKTGRVDATMRVTMRNDAPAAGLPSYIIGNAVEGGLEPGTSLMYVSIYTPLMLVDATVDGDPKTFTATRDLGRNAYSAPVVVDPGGSVTLEFQLSGRVRLSGGTYLLDVYNQVLPFPDQLTIRVTDGASKVALDASTMRGDLRVTVPATPGASRN